MQSVQNGGDTVTDKSIIRVKKKSNYAVIDKTFLEDKELSWKAKGIMTFMLSKPDNWTFYLKELIKHSTDGEASFRSGFNELKKRGYVQRVKHRQEDGTFKWETVVYEKPHGDFPHVENPHVEKPHVENQSLLNNEELNNEELNIYTVFEHWNTKQIIRHRKINQKTKSHINARLSEYSVDELKKAIDNYKDILEGDQYYWTHKWTLEDFMKPNNVIRFLDEAEPKKNFLKSGVPVVEEEQEQTKEERITEIKETLALGKDYFLMVDGNLNEYNKLKKELRKLERI